MRLNSGQPASERREGVKPRLALIEGVEAGATIADIQTTAAARDWPAEFEAHRELIEAIASQQFDQTSNKETRLVSIFAKHIRSRTAQT